MAWSSEQLANARFIMQVGRQLGASDRDITIALMAGWQESGLRNLNYGDGDSIGIFQQRNAWASRADRLNPTKAARMFFLGGEQGQRGLLDFNNRSQFSLGQAAQKVQVSAFPDAYNKWEDDSKALLKELGGSLPTPTDVTQPSGTPGPGDPNDFLAGTPGVLAPEQAPVTALGLAASTAPGLESGDQMPQFQSPDITQMQSLLDSGGSQSDGSQPSGVDFGPSDGGNAGARGNYSLPGVKSYVLSAANELGGRFGIKSIGGVGDRPNKSDHPGGKALDFMTKGAPGRSLASYAMANAKRLGITYIIFDQYIWSVGKADQGWRKMEDRGSPTANHQDHVHISFK